ncbi:MAG: hypothetical protein AB9891_00470 [Anaerolineaceae bacterium]
MKKILYSLILVTVILSGCAAPAVEAVIPVTAIDRCAPEAIQDEIEKITVFQRDFDDVSFLAQSTPQNQTAVVILELQRLRRKALDYDAPACLLTLKDLQIQYMNGVVSTLMRFMSGGDADLINQQLNAARELRVSYETELGLLLGIPYQTPTAFPTVVPPTATLEPTPVTMIVSTEQDINLFQGPGVNYAVVGNFLRGQQAMAYTRTENNEWILIQLLDNPEVQGWVAVRLIKMEGEIDILQALPQEALK